MSRFTSYRDIVDDFVARIQEGSLEHGARVPSMQTYADEHGVSKTMVQRAYSELRNLGYLESIGGKGTFVSWVHVDRDETAPSCRAFWSYAQLDDTRSHGAVTRLLESIKEEYALCTSVELDVFRDRDTISWGDDWQEQIDRGIAVSPLFVAVLTPTYLSRPACIEELKTALEMRRRNEIAAVLPLEYVSIRESLKALHDDDVANALAATQRVDVRELRFQTPGSPEYQRTVHQIVERLLEEESSGDAELNAKTEKLSGLDEDDPALLDGLTLIEKNMPLLMECLADANGAMDGVGRAIDAGNEQLNKGRKNKTLASNVLAVKMTAKRLEEPAQRFCDCANAYDAAIRETDRGVQVLYDFYSDFPTTPELHLAFQKNADLLASTLAQTGSAFQQMADFKRVVSQFKRLSKDLRRPCASLEHGVDLFISSATMFTKWERLFRELARTPGPRGC